MEVAIERVDEGTKEQVLIRCHAVTEEVRQIESFVRSRRGTLVGVRDAKQYPVPLSDVCYIESVDGRTFLYTKEQVYETPRRLYELEDLLRPRHFLRVSKSMLVDLMRLRSVRPAFNGRFTAVLDSGEEIIISRNYVKDLKAALKGE